MYVELRVIQSDLEGWGIVVGFGVKLMHAHPLFPPHSQAMVTARQEISKGIKINGSLGTSVHRLPLRSDGSVFL